MLELTRRCTERIVFPHLNMSVEVLGLADSTVRLGIDAPPDVLVVPEPAAPAAPPAASPLAADFRKWWHDVGNELHGIIVCLAVIRAQLGKTQSGKGLEDTLNSIDRSLATLQEQFRTAHSQLSFAPTTTSNQWS
jgi:hypothetical protein